MRQTAGFTLVELLITMLIAGILLTAVASMVISSARLHRSDLQRAEDDRTLRGAMDMITADLREAGERLPEITPVVQIYTATVPNGASTTNTSMLSLLRGLSDTYLPLCSTAAVRDTEQTVYVARTLGNPADTLIPFSTTRALPDACGATAGAALPWKTVLQDKITRGEGRTEGGRTRARAQGVILDVSGKRAGEFTLEDVAADGNTIVVSNFRLGTVSIEPRRSSTSQPQSDYRLYLVEKRNYWVENKDLYLQRDNGDKVIVMPDALSLTVQAYTGTASAAASLPFGAPFAQFNTPPSPDWRDLREVRVELVRRVGTTTRSLSDAILPRNSMSKDQ
ncbi:prepilin-type N-terminal cleavage/methylation domain-containing protein [uncultured Deinococcus sp.]|uniref:PilW family protein n=1 Tax=uncultured Deinococcus sp. TaxID=158789 RepID=UPI0025897520|nr:prepilin-type N-terminal cleavage/methylation domain-containing protein [uncultured Deinococcus sp.]